MTLKTKKDQIFAKLFTRFPGLVKRWAKSGRFITNIGTPWTPVSKALEESRIALVTTAGIHLQSQPPYDMEDENGDPSYREIPRNVREGSLMITHNYYDHKDADRDINVVFPIERLRELENEGIIGDAAPRHFSFMGHIKGPYVSTLVNQTSPEVARMLKADAVDAVFLTPAWGTCNQSVGLIQRAIEAAGIPTVSISLNRTITEKVRPPRAVLVHFSLGHPMGNPYDKALQRKILMLSLNHLQTITKPGMIVDFAETDQLHGKECALCTVPG